jgi:hypothetical protein
MSGLKLKLISSKKYLIVLLSILILLYGLSWAAYGVKYSHDKQIILRNYGGIVTYSCGNGGVAPPDGYGYIKTHPTSYVLPFEGVSYTIKYGIGPNIASGKILFSGKLTQTSIQYSNNPECELL